MSLALTWDAGISPADEADCLAVKPAGSANPGRAG
jgi:hypothetical protein